MASSKALRIVIIPESEGTSPRSSERGDQFEQLIGILLETLAFRVSRRLSSSGTEIDLLAENLVTGQKALVQCKDVARTIETSVVQQLHSQAITHNAVALLFATTPLTPQADEYLRKQIRPQFPNIWVYGPAEIVELLVTGRNLRRVDVVEAYVNNRGYEADAWSVCVFRNRVYWAAPVRRANEEKCRQWVLLRRNGELVSDAAFLGEGSSYFESRFRELGSPCA